MGCINGMFKIWPQSLYKSTSTWMEMRYVLILTLSSFFICGNIWVGISVSKFIVTLHEIGSWCFFIKVQYVNMFASCSFIPIFPISISPIHNSADSCSCDNSFVHPHCWKSCRNRFRDPECIVLDYALYVPCLDDFSSRALTRGDYQKRCVWAC